MMNKIYVGILEDNAPENICDNARKLSYHLAKAGYLARIVMIDNHIYFNKGCLKGEGLTETSFPWDKKNEKVYEIARKSNNNYQNYQPSTHNIIANNVVHVLGSDVNIPADFVICYSDGSNDKVFSQTNQIMMIAKKNNIQIFNLGDEYAVEQIKKFAVLEQ